MRYECPLLKMKTFKKDKRDKRESKKKALQATWDESESTTDEKSSSDGEVAHMCFMAKASGVSSLNNIDDFFMDELLDAFNDLYLKYKSLNVKCKSLNKSFVDVSLKKELLPNENDELRSKNKSFEIEIVF